jgi:hypothetical protein
MLIDLVKRWLRTASAYLLPVKRLEEPVILNWDRVIHKGVRTQDGQPVGYIAADDEHSIIILASRFKEYDIPKLRVKAFDGSQVYVDFPISELEQYRIK